MTKLLLSIVTLILLTACGQQPYGTLNVETVEDMRSKGVPIIDIRRPDQWKETGVIEGSHLITIFDAQNRFKASTFDDIANAIGGKDNPVILMGQTGRRSGAASTIMMEQMGFTEVYHAASGMSGWAVQKRPLIEPPAQ